MKLIYKSSNWNLVEWLPHHADGELIINEANL